MLLQFSQRLPFAVLLWWSATAKRWMTCQSSLSPLWRGVFSFHPLYRLDGHVWWLERNSHVAGRLVDIPKPSPDSAETGWNMLNYARGRTVLNLHVTCACGACGTTMQSCPHHGIVLVPTFVHFPNRTKVMMWPSQPRHRSFGSTVTTNNHKYSKTEWFNIVQHSSTFCKWFRLCENVC